MADAKDAEPNPPRTLLEAHEALARIRPSRRHLGSGCRITNVRPRCMPKSPRSIGVIITKASIGQSTRATAPRRSRRRFLMSGLSLSTKREARRVEKTLMTSRPQTLMQAHEVLVRVRPSTVRHCRYGSSITSDLPRCMPRSPRSIRVTMARLCIGRSGRGIVQRNLQLGSVCGGSPGTGFCRRRGRVACCLDEPCRIQERR
jgi:hypothetical protein